MNIGTADKALQILDRLCAALEAREQGNEGDWGWPTLAQNLAAIRAEIRGPSVVARPAGKPAPDAL